MHVPTALTFHDLPASEAVSASVERWVARLEQLHEPAGLARCEVMIEHARHHEFHVRVWLAAHDTWHALAADAERDDLYLAIADAFRGAHRQLRDRAPLRLAS